MDDLNRPHAGLTRSPHSPDSPHSGHRHSYSPSFESRLSSADRKPCWQLYRTGSGTWSREEAGSSTVSLLLPTADPAITDSTLGDIIVGNPSLDPDSRKCPRRTSLCLCLSCLDEQAQAAVSRCCCCEIVCRWIVIEENCSVWRWGAGGVRKPLLVGS